ncbi:protealysin inhibitor emfourin [Streptomyces sp. NPDC021224]|uniref:protealysin inhibitor emfourin n=1 Tax=unclassified Streptomyces TaxID=2593676 RepID=UPI0037AAC479
MRIEVTRSGGFAGLSRHAVLDTAARPDADHLHALARSALSAPPTVPTPTRDGYTYTLTIDGSTIEAADPTLTPAQRELVAEVLGEGA